MTIDELLQRLPANLRDLPRVRRGGEDVLMFPPVRRYLERNGIDPQSIEFLPLPPQPLDKTGALATLLVVTGNLELDDAANALRLDPQKLVDEALAWSAAAAG